MDPPSAASNAPAKTPVHRGARACMVCRQAKMKCVGAEDGTQRCQRCQRAGVDCVFEKHRRGRKPGSKLSEASKMLRRLEKGLNNAKAKQPVNSPHSQNSPSAQYGQEDGAGPSNFQGSSSQQYDDDMDDEEEDHTEEALYPEKVINASHKSSFLDIVMNPEPATTSTTESRPRSGASGDRANSLPKVAQSPTRSHGSPQPKPYSGLFNGYVPKDPIAAGIIDEADVSQFFDMFFLRLNPFINLFDPALHSPDYVRSHSPFLFTAMLMACCKFFNHNNYHAVRRLAEEWCVFTFAEGTESVETVQALACMTYWKEPTDRRTWSYIGMACRMAVNLRLNKYVGKRQPSETQLHFFERRNRERTYLVLFVHDRSLSMQTGKHWMLHEDEFVRNSATWHEDGCSGAVSEVRPEDVIVAAFVQLRLTGSEATDSFYNRTTLPSPTFSAFNHDLNKHNSKLDLWSEKWEHELRRSPQTGEFHIAFIRFFQSHVRLFLNTFGLNLASADTHVLPDPEAVQQCHRAACTNLQIITEFDKFHVLPYCQESINIMTAYAAIVLLRLLRVASATTHDDRTAEQIHGIVISAADAYQHAHIPGSDIDSAAYHSRFLRRLVAEDVEKARHQLDRSVFRQGEIPPLFAPALPPLRTAQSSSAQHMPQQDFYSLPRPGPSHGHSAAPLPPLSMLEPPSHHMSGFPPHNSSPLDVRGNGVLHNGTRAPPTYPQVQSVTESDDHYWAYMHHEVAEFPRADVTAANVGFAGNPFNSYASSSQHREPQFSSGFGGYPHSRSGPASHAHYLPPMPSFGNAAYDTSR
ncbi:uncharacterized protein TRAVEDRAFT_165719 [Trametes versicolor FP-101664 SS1]|uniref:uncharacterized protein n=1 Tax=Trametes versicolor (strain FP-101664) TaxID=717944 RepID=UPI0004623C5D|nr:uncharacterized protein TRAVEDRAFT_165719 [Trametes versicolor FP-101664 SS1]EIW60705.1 hypothetical protein TRAVEDRAFT_165719 [Trametes versicolor FP-101664 SS1]